MNKGDLVSAMAEVTGMTKKDTAAAVDAFIEVVSETLEKGEDVALVGFGTFKVKERAARKGRNPQTGEEIDIPASNVVSFKVGKTLKDAVKEVKKEKGERKLSLFFCQHFDIFLKKLLTFSKCYVIMRLV